MRDPKEIICHCNQITYETIEKEIKNGAKTPEEITEQTDAGNACGYCLETLEELLEEFE